MGAGCGKNQVNDGDDDTSEGKVDIGQLAVTEVPNGKCQGNLGFYWVYLPWLYVCYMYPNISNKGRTCPPI